MDDRLGARARARRRRRGRRRCRGRRAGPRSRSARRPGRGAARRAPRRGCGCRPGRPARARVLLDDLVRDPHQRAAQIVAVEDDLVVSVQALAPSWPLWTGLKEPTRASLAGPRGRIPRARPPMRSCGRWPAPAMPTREAIEVHQAAGRRFAAGGVGSFVREQGDGAPVVLLHGVPTSSFLYRKVIPALAEQGLRAVAFDFPGLGLAERPEELRLLVVGARRAGPARRSTRSGSSAATWSSTTSAGRSAASGRCATPTGCSR